MRWWSEWGAGRIDVVIRGAGVLVVAGVLAGGGAYVIGGGDDGEAHAFVNEDVSGHTCTRASEPVTFEEAEAANDLCGTFDAANDVMQNGDTAIIRGGSYGAQSITGSNSRTAMATMTIADGETANLSGSLGIQGAAWITVDGGGTLHGEDARIITGDAGGTGAPGGVAVTENQASGTIGDSDNVALIGIDFGGWAVEDSTNATVKWNDIGPCHSSDGSGTNSGSPNCDNGSIEYCEATELSGICRGYNTGHLVEGNYIHDFGCDQNFYNGSGSDDCHWECMYVSYANDLTIRGNMFVNCANGGNLFNTFSNGGGSFTADFGYTDYLIENNVFTSSCNNSSAPCGGRTGEATGVGHCGIFSGNDFDNTIIRFNTFIDANFGLECAGQGDDGGFLASSDDFQFIGNVLDFPGSGTTCGNDWDENTGGAAMTVNYNIFYTGTFTCGTNGFNVGSTITGMIVANSLTAPDAHLTGAANDLDEFVPASLCPSVDFEGDLRDTSSGDCDAGADER